MQKYHNLPLRLAVPAVLAAASILQAGETKIWTTAEQSDLVKGTLKKLSVRSDGRLTLAPVFREVLDASAPYLWALAEDSKGNVYAGGGGPAGAPLKLHRIDAAGKVSVHSELEGLAIHALAVDRQDRVYAATSPDGKVYRINSSGKPEVFYEPKCKYIWAMAFSAKGEIFVATGDQGQVHRVGADGKGGVFFETEEVHARSLAVDASGNLVVGTEPSGLILRVTPAGAGFVLHQGGKREVTAVAVAPDGSIYAAAAGNKAAAPMPSPGPAPAAPAGPAPSPAPMGAATLQPRPAAAPPATFSAPAPSLTGGSEVYRIHPDGYPTRVWSDAQEIVYALGFDPQGRPLIGTGNKGAIHRLDSDVLSTLLTSASPTQITAFSAARQGRLFAATGNIGKVFQIGPGLEAEGTLESEAFDAQLFSQWGRLTYDGDARGGKVVFETRSGNLDRPQKNWSPWAPVDLAGLARVASPAARFLQWKLLLTGAGDGSSPEVTTVDVAYLTRNVAPVVERIEATPPNYRFPPQTLTMTPSNNLTLPAMGQRRRATTGPIITESSITMQYGKGHVGARWQASDANGDSLTYIVEIRGAGETEWKLLRDKVRDKYISWDSVSFPDGEYRVRVTASDSPSNPPPQALTAQAESDSFLIDNTAPRINGLTASVAGSKLTARWKAADGHSTLDKCEYSINGGDWTPVEPTTKLSDSWEHDYELAIDSAPAGEITVAVRVTDSWDNQAVEKAVVKR